MRDLLSASETQQHTLHTETAGLIPLPALLQLVGSGLPSTHIHMRIPYALELKSTYIKLSWGSHGVSSIFQVFYVQSDTFFSNSYHQLNNYYCGCNQIVWAFYTVTLFFPTLNISWTITTGKPNQLLNELGLSFNMLCMQPFCGVDNQAIYFIMKC